MKHIATPQSFIYPEFKDTDYTFGSGQYKGKALREDGDWRDYTPPFELQKLFGLDSSACYKEAPQHAVAVIQEEQFDLPDQNYASRFNDQENATPQGGNPLNALDSFRHDGLIPDSMLPFGEYIKTWQDFNSFLGGNENACRAAGKLWLKRWTVNYDIVYRREDSVEQKYNKLREALKYSPVPMSVYAWVESNGQYIKPRGTQDQHLVLCLYLDEQNRAHILDTYEPFIKVLEPFYNSDFGMRIGLAKIPESAKNGFWEALRNFFKYVTTIKLD